MLKFMLKYIPLKFLDKAYQIQQSPLSICSCGTLFLGLFKVCKDNKSKKTSLEETWQSDNAPAPDLNCGKIKVKTVHSY